MPLRFNGDPIKAVSVFFSNAAVAASRAGMLIRKNGALLAAGDRQWLGRLGALRRLLGHRHRSGWVGKVELWLGVVAVLGVCV
jgi:hypothetical protein